MSAGDRLTRRTPSALRAQDIRVRAITPGELHAFAGISSGPDYTFAPSRPSAFEAWLRRYWETGNSCPEWCFVAELDGRSIGSVVYEGDVRGHSVHVEHVRVPWRGDYLRFGGHLLRESLRILDARQRLDYVYGFLKTPPLTGRARAVRRALLEHTGFTLRRQQLYYIWIPGTDRPPAPRHPGGVRFRSLAEVGESAWLEADARVRLGALVPDIVAGARRRGEPLFPPGHVKSDELRWWQLAYTAAGDLIGLVVPKRNGASGSIHWIGVVPEQRGRGYVDDLIARGLEILVAAGVERMHAATHLLNTPMQAAFPRMCFRQTEMRWWYELDVAHLRRLAAGTRAAGRTTR